MSVKKRIIAVTILVLALVVLATAAPVVMAQSSRGDKVVFNENYVLSSGQALDGNLAVIGGSATLEPGSEVRGDVAVAGGQLRIQGRVNGNVTLFGGRAVLADTAVIEGDLATFGGTVDRSPGAVIQGSVFGGTRERDTSPSTPGWWNRGMFGNRLEPMDRATSGIGRFIRWQLGTFGLGLLMALLGLVVVLLAPRPLGRVATTLSQQTALSFGVGFLTFAVGLLGGLVLLIACGLGLLVWLALLAAAVLGWIAFGLWLGQLLLNALKIRTASSVAEVIVGVFLITFVSRLPLCIGFLFGLIAGSIGIGAVVLTRFGTRDSDGSILGKSDVPAPIVPAGPGPQFTDWMDAGTRAPSTPEPASTPIVDVVPEEGYASAETVGIEPAEWIELPATGLDAVQGIDSELGERLAAGGIATLQDLAVAEPGRLADLTGVPVGQILLEDWIGQARRLAG